MLINFRYHLTWCFTVLKTYSRHLFPSDGHGTIQDEKQYRMRNRRKRLNLKCIREMMIFNDFFFFSCLFLGSSTFTSFTWRVFFVVVFWEFFFSSFAAFCLIQFGTPQTPSTLHRSHCYSYNMLHLTSTVRVMTMVGQRKTLRHIICQMAWYFEFRSSISKSSVFFFHQFFFQV